jgi:hypothetical protein
MTPLRKIITKAQFFVDSEESLLIIENLNYIQILVP